MSSLFTPIAREDEMNFSFYGTMIAPGNQPARDIMDELFSRLPNSDENFVKDFQTAGFISRVWELLYGSLSPSKTRSRPC